MTTRTIFPLLLALASLALGCQDKKDAEVIPKHERAPSVTPKLEAPALTAAAPTQPLSVADMPKPEQAQATDEAKGDDGPKVPKDELTLGVTELGHADPDAMDDDRPIDARDVVVDRFVLATGVAGREPVGESDHFDADTAKLFAFVQLANPDAPYAFTVHFEPVDGPRSHFGVKLDVPTATRWRTWAWTKLVHEPGKYRAVLRTLEGEEIVSREFTIDPAL